MDEQKIIMHVSMVKEFIDNCDLKDDEKLMVLKNCACHQENVNNQRMQHELMKAHAQKILS
ncbi:hypothetical protein ACT21L_004381 [Vibrio vulnificus]